MTERRTERRTESPEDLQSQEGQQGQQGQEGRVNGSERPELVTKLVSARPIRSEGAAERLATTLESLGSDPAVVAAARKG